MEEGDSLCCFILHNWASPIWTKQRWKPIRKSAKRSAPAAWAKRPLPQQLLHRPPVLSALWQHQPRVQAGGHEPGRLLRQGDVCLDGLPRGGVRWRQAEAVQFQGRAGRGRPAGSSGERTAQHPTSERRRRGGNCPPESRESRPEAAPALERGRAERGPAQARIGLPRQETGACQRAQRCRAPQARPAAEQAGI